ncbi:bifunctional phosphoribosylaminoimidazolecarboxamide formyltransferase/IMP cyclohydrolase [Demetria terragena]|uniref:bifunctional phosphoribosylaminoimidazolecarboxamide formyltransferase/IMP cyclohydrolase n=1 Tax=Demetria terragena TaxID=63959 RepID=UPI000374822A|nr:bifunctional phosphoribosylaminoimidazolecarboxamide formyltransferase/IMP cyclohydrolase [Demetria terragena]
MTPDRRPLRRALISVYDKSGLDDLARGLHAVGIELVSTGGSSALIESLGIPVTKVEDLTGFPECLEGRVKTLHPMVHAGILADSRKAEHVQQLDQLGVEPFDLVVSNLYPFTQTVASGASPDECVEQIDIGGPSMVRAAAKNHPTVAIVTSPDRYPDIENAVAAGGFTLAERQQLAAEAFEHTASYDVAVASWMQRFAGEGASERDLPGWFGQTWTKERGLRYGENPHQQAALYADPAARDGSSLAHAEQLHGKDMSFNNYVDADAAMRAAYDHGDQPTVAVIKHANPCGIAVGSDVADAHAKAHACDPVSAYGGVIATNTTVSAAMAETVKDIFTEVVVAPDYEPEAVEILQRKKAIRLLRTDGRPGEVDIRMISGGALLQEFDRLDAQVTDESGAVVGGDTVADWRLVAGTAASESTLHDLAFAWRAIRAVKSNAILLARDGASVGIGMGQVNRVDSCHLAVQRAGADRARGSVAASDAFFPFADGLQVLLDAGVRAVVAPGGSKRDAETIEAAEQAGVTMYFTGARHFAH